DSRGLVVLEVDVEDRVGPSVHVRHGGATVETATVTGQDATLVIELRAFEVDSRAREAAGVRTDDVLDEVDVNQVRDRVDLGERSTVGVPGAVPFEANGGHRHLAGNEHAGSARAVL